MVPGKFAAHPGFVWAGIARGEPGAFVVRDFWIFERAVVAFVFDHVQCAAFLSSRDRVVGYHGAIVDAVFKIEPKPSCAAGFWVGDVGFVDAESFGVD